MELLVFIYFDLFFTYFSKIITFGGLGEGEGEMTRVTVNFVVDRKGFYDSYYKDNIID